MCAFIFASAISNFNTKKKRNGYIHLQIGSVRCGATDWCGSRAMPPLSRSHRDERRGESRHHKDTPSHEGDHTSADYPFCRRVPHVP